jgi:Fe2+ or Zn2+ uptake regulation protein
MLQPTLFDQSLIHDHSTPLLKEDKERLETSASKQRNGVLAIFKSNPSYNFSAEEVWKIYRKENHNVPLTSIRRCITNLMIVDGLLTKDEDIRKVSQYGVSCCTYKLKG